MSFSTELFLEYKKRPGKPALARLLECHQDAVYTLCRQVLRHPQDAEDACQEVLLEVSRQIDAIEEPERFSGWLYRTALHTALDLKRQRGRRQARESSARRDAQTSAPEDHGALHEGLAELDDTSRQLVVEHYFARRPLRELAAERGCSEVAVWKRIQCARERLKSTLGSVALSALDGTTRIQAPVGLAKKALLGGGLTMAASGGIKVAIAAPLLLLAGAGAFMMARRPAPPPVEAAAKAAPTGGLSRKSLPASTVDRPAPPIARGAAPAKPAPRRPYPYQSPPPAPSNAAARAWSILSTRRVTLDEENISMAEVLNRLCGEAGLTLILDPAAIDGETISFKVQDIVLDGSFRLMLQPRDRAYEIRPDGSIHVGKTEDIQGGYEKVAREIRDIPQELDQAREMLAHGWNGVDPLPDARERDVRAKKITIPQGESNLEAELLRLREQDHVFVQLDRPGGSPGAGVSGGEFSAWQESRRKPFLQVVEEKTVVEHLDELARRAGLVLVVSEGGDNFYLTTEEQAAAHRAADAEMKRLHEETLRTFTKPLSVSGPLTMPDLCDAVAKSSGWPVVPSEDVWGSGASVQLPAGATLREILDSLKVHGFHWVLSYEKIYIFN